MVDEKVLFASVAIGDKQNLMKALDSWSSYGAGFTDSMYRTKREELYAEMLAKKIVVFFVLLVGTAATIGVLKLMFESKAL